MDIIGSSIELTRIIFLLGAVLALLYKKRFGVTPGGIIVPGTLAGIVFSSFTAFLIVLASAGLCYGLYKVLFGSIALTRRWSSLVNVSISLVIGLALTVILNHTHQLSQELTMISFITPGLISIGARKYGFAKVMGGTLAVTAVCSAVAWFMALVLPYSMLTYLTVKLAGTTPLLLDNPYITLPISLLSAILVYYRFGIRGGGYLIAPFIAVVIFNSPIQALLLFAGVALSYLAVHTVQRFSMVIGLERFVLSLFCGYLVVTLMDFLAITFAIPGYTSAPLVLIITVAVLTNDLTLQPIKDSLAKGFMPTQIASYVTRLVI